MNNFISNSNVTKLTRRSWLTTTPRLLLPVATGMRLPLFAQVLGTLSGMVIDASGAVVPNAQVRITNKETGETRDVKTNYSGNYVFSGIPAGKYEILVSTSGFSTARIQGVTVTSGESAAANVNLSVGSVSEPVQVENGQRITSRAFLVGDSDEEAGFGLYSYMLFGRQPVDATRERYRALIREYLALPEAANFKKMSSRQFNITYLPVSKPPLAPTPDSVLNDYNFVRAVILLSKIPGGPYVDGPYIVSWQGPLTDVATLPRDGYLFQDLSSVPAEIIIVWVHEFLVQSSQKDYWKKRKGADTALKLRTAIAQVAAGVDPATKSLQQWQSILATLIGWKPGTTAK